MKSDNINHPDHYCYGGIETIEYIKAKLSPEEYRGYMKGSVIKYLSRAGHKDDVIQDLKKAQWYLNRLIQVTKLPFRPTLGETYYRIRFSKWNRGEQVEIFKGEWEGDSIDYVNLKVGNAFRTKAEAEAHKNEVYKNLTIG